MAKQSKIINQRDVQFALDRASKGKSFKVTSSKSVTNLNADIAILADTSACLVALIKELQIKGIINA